MGICNTTSAKSIMVAVETYFSFRVLSRFFYADKLSSRGIFGYNPTTSIAHKIKLLGNFERERRYYSGLPKTLCNIL